MRNWTENVTPIWKKKKKKISLIAFKAAVQPRLEQIRVVTTCFFYSTVNIWSASRTSFLYQCVFWWDDTYFCFLTLATRRTERLSDPNDSLLTIVYNFRLIFFYFFFYKVMASKDISPSNISSQNIIGNPLSPYCVDIMFSSISIRDLGWRSG